MRPTHLFVPSFVAVVLGTVVTLYTTQSVSSDQEDQIIGTWQLNVAKSKYQPGPGPVSETRTYKRGPTGIEGLIQRRFADGRVDRIEYVAEFDREYPVTGTAEYDHILLKRINARTAEATLSHAGRVYGTARRIISESGATMTITFEQKNEGGRPVMNVAVYEKVEP